MVRICSLMIHTDKHSVQEVILNRDLFKELADGDYINVYDPEKPSRKLCLRVANQATPSLAASGRLEISILKTVADLLNVKPFSRVCVDKVGLADAEVDFVELAFKKQFLQRGNLWRFKNALPVGQPIHVNSNINVDGINAQIQEIGRNGSEIATISGVITEKTHFIFRSRSTRIIWLVQISKEMYEADQNNDLYFEKFLSKFVAPLIDQWKTLGVSHLLSVIFFSRTLYPGKDSNTETSPYGFPSKNIPFALNKTREGIYYKDFFKTVIDSIQDYDKKTILRVLKEEFWDFGVRAGWNLGKDEAPLSSTSHAIPSDAPSGNFLEAINSTLNFLDKHYIDRDLQRTGNSIVMISAGTGIFRVRPGLQQITKQRMMDNGIGMDFISLSQPPLHTVPLFLIECSNENGIKDFYEVPHWMNITFVDCDIDPSASISGRSSMSEAEIRRWRDPTDPQNRANPRWTGLEAVLIADEEAGGKLVNVEGFLMYIPPENTNKYIGRKFEASDIWRDENEFQPLPFADIIGGFFQAQNAAEGHLRAMPLFLKRFLAQQHNNRSTMSDDPSGCSLQSAAPHPDAIHPWGWLSFDEKKSRIPSGDFDNISTNLSNWAIPCLPALPSDKHANDTFLLTSSTADEAKQELGSTKAGSSFDDMPRSIPRRGLYGDSHLLSKQSKVYVNEVDELMQQIASGSDTLSKDLLNTFDASAVLFAVGNVPAPTGATAAATTNSSNHGDDKRRRSIVAGTPVRGCSGFDGNSRSYEDNLISASMTRKPRMPVSALMHHHLSSTGQLSSDLHTPPTNQHLHMNSPPSGESRVSHGVSDSQQGLAMNRAGMTREKISKHFKNGGQSYAPSQQDVSLDDEIQQREFIRTYRKKYAINPFRKEEGKAFLETRTHNRRRWSHVFPAYSIGRQENANSYFGLNKKSLTQPAILPMTTDFVPAAKELLNNYDIQSTYKLIIYTGDCAYNSQENLLKEMVCQRLSMEYQLGEGLHAEEYLRLNKSLAGVNNASTFILTMGHRIHILAYDASGQGEIVVTRYISKRGTNSAKNTYDTYKFEVWVPQDKQFQTVLQKFCQYPQPEYAWNRADEILLGNEELDTEGLKYLDYDLSSSDISLTPQIKSRKLCFAILTPESLDNLEEYLGRVELLLQFLQKGSDSQKVKVITKLSDTPVLASTKQSPAVIVKLFLKGPKHENQKWIYLRLDGQFDPQKTYHIQLHWLVCDSWLIEDWISVLFRRCTGWGLRIIQTPEFFRTANLQIHPFRALPRVTIPFCDHPNYPSCVLLVERLFLKGSAKWSEDGECLTDWKSLGLNPPNYFNNLLTELKEPEKSTVPLSSGVSALSTSIMNGLMKRDVFRVPNRGEDAKLKRLPDRQYIHRSGYASVRLAPHGFVWLPNPRPRTNENTMNVTQDERREASLLVQRDLEAYCEGAGICFSILVDIIEDTMNRGDSSCISTDSEM